MKAAGADSAASAPVDKAPLDDVMLAMDVVDTLRRRQQLAARELDTAGREQDLKARLHRIYQGQGIEVPEHILDEGVAALKEDRFVYRPPPDSWAVRFARIYVSRGRWGAWLFGALGVLCLGWALYYFILVAPAAALPERIATAYADTIALAGTETAREEAERLRDAGRFAVAADDREGARQALAKLDAMQALLAQEYQLRIVNRPGERTGVWRVPDINTQARNYYIVVEAIDPAGRALEVPVTSEETGKTQTVSAWGLRVDHPTFERIAEDKRDDGIIQNAEFGHKPLGALQPEYRMPTTGGAITKW
ncbi:MULTISPECIES: DUF6384 family protein [Thiorhodovibrio]|uniref:DUF6384 family protein n=1 Tax=Thiorhodovibrio TaxID=61593 RepID=UPI001912F1F9|nr:MULTISPECIES: DUF6384 family protein [Thiorhodovibrio]MBK5969632.1 hypothetical protein [Thiorhodovibrio winogradskyi]WPL14700.1 hypothetical protein Thiosp_04555 [Thiorhodovibrio litoralis]